MNDDMLDEADEDSFPASDPPAQTIPAADEPAGPPQEIEEPGSQGPQAD